MFRYFTNKNDISDSTVYITGTDAKHLKNTLRADIDQEVSIVTTQCEYIAKITKILDDKIECRIVEETNINNETNIDVILVQGLPKQTKMESIIQQNVEIGVKGFIPLVTNRCVVKINDKSKESKKLDRWRKIAHESSKQSRRNIVPFVDNVTTFKELLQKLKNENAKIIVPYELEDTKTIKEVLADKCEKYYIVIGPEGGFELEEILQLKQIGAKIVTLGKRILRTQTAGIVASSVILYENGELDK